MSSNYLDVQNKYNKVMVSQNGNDKQQFLRSKEEKQ